MKRYRGENPAYTKWPPRAAWPYIPAAKWGARQKQQRAQIAQANANIHRQVAKALKGTPNYAYSVVAQAGGGGTMVGPVAAMPDFRIHWDKPPSKATQDAMAEVIVAATKHFL